MRDLVPRDPLAWQPTAAALAWIERANGPAARVVRIEALPASSTAKHRVEVALADGATRRLLLRRYHDATRLAADPWYVPAHDARVLELLAGTGVPAPRLRAADLAGAFCEVPALLESWLPGATAWRPDDLERYLARAAETLVAIHEVRVPSGVALPRYAPYNAGMRPVSPPYSTRPGLWERVADVLEAPWPAHRTTFIHRDYHPGNVLWDGARVAGVVDWSTAAWGPPGIDLARMRVNLASALGRAAAERFTALYAAAGGDASARGAYWDLLDAADLLPDLTPPARPDLAAVARLEDHVAAVLAEVRG